MKAIITNKEDPTIKVEYNHPHNVSVQQYINPDVGYDSSPVWVLELGNGYRYETASFKCSEWSVDII